jgi:MFS family permease
VWVVEGVDAANRVAVGPRFGLAGVAGAAAAGQAGRLADQGKGQWTTGIGLGLLLISWTCIGGLHRSLLTLVIGIVLLDFAIQAVHVTNQSLIFAAQPEAKSRLVAAYMVFYSIGSGIGAIAATRTYAAFQWAGVYWEPLLAWQPWGSGLSPRICRGDERFQTARGFFDSRPHLAPSAQRALPARDLGLRLILGDCALIDESDPVCRPVPHL